MPKRRHKPLCLWSGQISSKPTPNQDKKLPDSVFLSSEIQATDSTCTGCKAKTAAANQAPGTASCCKILSRSSAKMREAKCLPYGSPKLNRPTVCAPSQKALCVSGNLLRCTGLEPDARQTIQRPKFGSGDVSLIVQIGWPFTRAGKRQGSVTSSNANNQPRFHRTPGNFAIPFAAGPEESVAAKAGLLGRD